MADSIIANDQQAIIKGLNFALQKFLSQAQVLVQEENVLVGVTDKLATRIKQKKLKKVINNF